MNDEFLTQSLPDVRPAFEKALQGKLHIIERQQRRRARTIATALVVVMLTSLALTLPPVRAQMRWLLREIGGIKFVETENPQEEREAIRAAFAMPTPTGSDLNGVYRLEEIVKTFPYVLDAPVWKPDGYAQDDDVNIQFSADDPHITLNWHKFACDSCMTYISFEIRKMPGGNHPTSTAFEGIAGASAEAIRLGDTTATLLRFHPSTNGGDGIAWALVWRVEKDGDLFEYRLSSNDLQLTHNDRLRMANTTGFGWYVEKIRQREGLPMVNVNLPEILAAYPELARFLPAWTPTGFTLAACRRERQTLQKPGFWVSNRVVWLQKPAFLDLKTGFLNLSDSLLDEQIPVDPINGMVILPWRLDNKEAPDTPPIYITLSIGSPWNIPFVVKPDTIKEVTIGNVSAAMWEVEFLREWDPEGRTYSLCCLQNDLQYCLSWREPGVTFDDILRMVESIPGDAELPAEWGFLDDLRQK